MSTRSVPKARQVAGPGVPGTESDTPVYHVDVDREQLTALVTSPVKFLARAGLGAEQGIAPGGAMNVNLSRFDLRWTNDGWQSVDGGEPTTKWCCYVVGDTTTCHPH